MPQADSNRAKIRFSRETSWGETPVSPATTEMRVTSETLGHQKGTVVSQEVRSDRQRPNVLEVGQAANGPIGFELTYGTFESFFETSLRGTIASTVVGAASVTFAASSITAPAGTDFTGFAVGQWIRVKDTGGANNQAVVRVAARTSTVITTTGSTLTPAVRASAAVNGRTLVNGTTKTSFFLETDFEDLNAVKYFTGMRVDTMALSIQSGQIVTGSFTFQGKRGFAANTSQAGTTTSANTNTPMTAAVNVINIREGDSELGTAVQGVSFALSNNMRTRPQTGSKTSAEPGDGGLDVTGNLNAYFEDISLYNKLINHTTTSIEMKFSDADSNVIVLSVPTVRYSQGNPPVPGQDQDVFLGLDFVGSLDSDENITIRMDFLPA